MFRYQIPVAATDFGTKSVRRNIGYAVVGKVSDFTDPQKQPHPDMLQGAGRVSQTEPCELRNAFFENNMFFRGDSRCDEVQGPFTNYLLRNCVFRRNLILSFASTHGITIQNSHENVIEENTVIGCDPAGSGASPAINTGWGTGAGTNPPPPSVGPHTIRRNIMGGLNNYSPDATFALNDQARAGNIRIHSTSGHENYQQAFGRSTFGPATPEEAIAWFTPKVGSLAAIAGAIDTNGRWRTGDSEPAMTDRPALATPAAGQIGVTPAATIWDGGSPVTSRDLRYSTDGVTWVTVTGIRRPETITGLFGGTLYSVQTREVNAVGAGPWSAAAAIRTT
jgi:parallel beta-helix repeat protein